MSDNFKKQSWISILLLSLITFGIYIPFWYKKIMKVTDTFPQEKKLNSASIIILMIASFLIPFFSITLTTTMNGVENVFTTNIYGIGTILNILRALLIIFLSFNLRSILQSQYGTDLNAVLTFFLGPIFLQHKINSLIEKSPTQQQVNQQPAPYSPRIQQLIEYIKSNEAQGYNPQQLRNALLQQGYQQNEVDEAIRLANQ